MNLFPHFISLFFFNSGSHFFGHQNNLEDATLLIFRNGVRHTERSSIPKKDLNAWESGHLQNIMKSYDIGKLSLVGPLLADVDIKGFAISKSIPTDIDEFEKSDPIVSNKLMKLMRIKVMIPKGALGKAPKFMDLQRYFVHVAEPTTAWPEQVSPFLKRELVNLLTQLNEGYAHKATHFFAYSSEASKPFVCVMSSDETPKGDAWLGNILFKRGYLSLNSYPLMIPKGTFAVR